ncbi:MAG TPA: ATP-binding cassette domain-containing protein [Conexibacter sp.]|nr:ATP-binding cassette domain-containing protein [Conexibacter sp.]
MTLLTLEHVRVRRGRRVVLADASLEVEPGELVVLGASRRAGKSTLLQVAAGLIEPEHGAVRVSGFAGADDARGRDGGIAFVRTDFSRAMGATILDQVAHPRTAFVSPRRAELEAFDALRRVVAVALGAEPGSGATLDHGEKMRIGIARALMSRPRLLLIDEPTVGLFGEERDEMVGLLRSLARDERVAVLATTDSVSGFGRWRHLSLEDGVVEGPRAQPPARIVQFPGEQRR